MNKILRVDSKSTLRWFIDYFIKTTPLVFSEISRAVKQNILFKNIYILIVNYGNLLFLTFTVSHILIYFKILFHYYSEVGIANFFLSPLIANPLIYLGVR
jgi:hypothetical protein